MYDIKQFRPALYLLLVMGMTGFALAVEAPGLWLIAILGLLLHLWLVRTGRFRPLPRLLANVVTLGALGFTFNAMRTTAAPIITIGQFLVLLQLVKLFEVRANRDYAQLIVLSLLLMVAAAISTPALLFGVILIAYLFVSLYCCLLFHLKVENDHALAAQTLPPERLDQATVKQDQYALPRSMRKLAAVVTSAAIVTAVAVFLFFPRGSGAGMFGQIQFRPAQTLTGFSDNDVSFGDVNRIQQNTDTVGQVQVWKNDVPLEGTVPLYLRGKTFDRYNLTTRKWTRTDTGSRDQSAVADAEIDLSPRPQASATDVYRQHFILKPTGTRTLFAMAGPFRVTATRDLGKVRFFPDDQTLSAGENLYQRLEYTVLSQDVPVVPNPVQRLVDRVTRISGSGDVPPPFTQESRPTEAVARYALRPDVSGSDDQERPLATLRPRNAVVHELDAQIAANVERHLRAAFTYTLDLTDTPRDADKDPNEQFLYDWKRGHCEYFASSMVLLCQSLGLQARMVTGFKCDEFDPDLGKYYIIRQSHAHAWVEVKTPAGWQTFDPTTANEGFGTTDRTAWQSMKHFFNWLEFKWANSVVAYDGKRRNDLAGRVEQGVINSMLSTGQSPRNALRRAVEWWDALADRFGNWFQTRGWIVSARIMSVVIVLLLAAILWGVLQPVLRRRRMRRRAARIGLDNLPTAEQLRLARQLGFYEHLTRALERRDIVRPRHLTPAEFATSLTFLPTAAFDAVRRLTDAFYAIRYGHAQLAPDEQKALDHQAQSIDPLLDPPRR